MILTAYFDESGTHGGSPVTIISGILGNAKQWAAYEAGLKRLKRKYGFSTFHGKDFKHRSGEFKGWSIEKCVSLIFDMSNLAAPLTARVVFRLDNDLYEKEYLPGEKPSKVRLDSKYGLAFRACLGHLIAELNKRAPKSSDKPHHINAVLEAGHKNAGDAERIFHEMSKAYQPEGKRPLGTITFADKADCDLLMAADFYAYTMFMTDGQERRAGREMPHPPAGDKNIFRQYRAKPGELARFRASLISEFLAKRKRGGTS